MSPFVMVNDLIEINGSRKPPPDSRDAPSPPENFSVFFAPPLGGAILPAAEGRRGDFDPFGSPCSPARARVRHRGFALIATLAILVVVTILLVAFATTMRTERAASQNFVDRDRAEAIAHGMLDRIVAEHAAPRVNGAPLKPFKVNDGTNGTPPTGLPDDLTAENYFAAGNDPLTGPKVPIPSPAQRQALQPVYEMVPEDHDAFVKNGLVRTSKPAAGTDKKAYDAQFWAREGLISSLLGSDVAEISEANVPRWVDYYQPDDPSTDGTDESQSPVAQVAFAIWDDGGKIDVNTVGEDKSVNGIAPHNLKIENEITADQGVRLLAFLDNANGNGKRDRNNFSLRNIISRFPDFRAGATGTDDEGDDHRVFSLRELAYRGLITPGKLNLVTTNSRDFDVRPEWDGDRAPRALRKPDSAFGSEDFLRSYINNPALYRLIYGSGGAGPYLVDNTLNDEDLEARLMRGGSNLQPSPNSPDEADDGHANWMQVMRLLAVLRRSMPPYADPSGLLSSPTDDPKNDLALNKWNAHDIWGIAQNMVQASAPASDHNLVAYNVAIASYAKLPHDDWNARLGTRLSPLITEVAVKVTKIKNQDSYQLTQYVKLWNPYPFELKHNGAPIRYRVGNYTNNQWPNGTSSDPGIWELKERRSVVENITAPPPGEFKVVRFKPSAAIPKSTIEKNQNGDTSKLFRIRPFLQNMDYSRTYVTGITEKESAYISLQMGTFYAKSGTLDQYDQLVADIAMHLPKEDEVKWYSFQIDDPRMGSIKRNRDIGRPGDAFPFPPLSAAHKWSWILYNQHAMQGCPVWEDNLLRPATERLVNDATVKNGVDPDMASNYNGKSFNGVSGYNRNFGINWPGADPNNGVTSEKDFAKMMATFALPGRPFLNIGEIGTVFAYRPWVTLNFANKIIPDDDVLGASVTPAIPSPADSNAALLRPAAILDYFTTIGTPASMNFNHPDQALLRYIDPELFAADSGALPKLTTTQFQQSRRFQDKTWLFESLKDGSTIDKQTPNGNLRPIRGRINLNTASAEVLTTLLKAPYRMPASWGLYLNGNFEKKTLITSPEGNSLPKPGLGTDATDYLVTIQESDARAMAEAIAAPIEDSKAIRPLRMLSDLSQLYDRNPAVMKSLYDKYPQSVISAMIGRLAQFGTVRQQSYTIDLVVRTLNPAAEKRGQRVVTGEARLQARVFFDTFSRKSFIESMEYR